MCGGLLKCIATSQVFLLAFIDDLWFRESNFEFSSSRADILTRQPLLYELGFASLGGRKRVGVQKEIFTKIASLFFN